MRLQPRSTRIYITALTALLVLAVGQVVKAQTFTVTNSCNQTVWAAIYPGTVYQNGGWAMAPNTSVTFPVPATYNGRMWGRKNCNTNVSPATCDTGQCGGTGIQCAGTTGQPTTALAEFNLAGGGSDWYDVSYVDAYDWPMAITVSNGSCYSPTCTSDSLSRCPAVLQKKNASGVVISCTNPCSVLKTNLVCCTGIAAGPCRETVNQWPADAQEYVNIVHNNCGEDYTYPWDDWWGLHTCAPVDSNYTITFCPNGVQAGGGPTDDNYPFAPTGIAGSSSNGVANISWNAISNATSYNVYRNVNKGGSNGSNRDGSIVGSNITGTSFADTTGTNGTLYYYTARSNNALGFSALSAQAAVTFSGTGGGGPPPTPTGLAASGGNATVAVSWNTANTATSYSVFRSTVSGGEGTTALATTTSTSYTDNAVTNGTTYFYKVSATNSHGSSAQSGEVSATPAAGGPPATPTGVTATAGNTQVTVAWSTDSGATSYNIFRSTTSGGEGTTAIATTASTSFVNTGLTNGTKYFYTVSATNANGSSAQSAEVNATPSTGPPPGISINCGGAAASPFVADTDFTGGATSSTTHAVDTSLLTAPIPPQAVLQTNRHGAITYTVGGFTAGSAHTVTLYFEEHYWTAAGKRKFNVAINGTTELTSFDIFATAGAQFKAVQRAFTVNANSSGQEVIVFTNVVDNAMVNGISVN